VINDDDVTATNRIFIGPEFELALSDGLNVDSVRDLFEIETSKEKLCCDICCDLSESCLRR